MILEGIVTSIGENGDVNVAPMGPIIDAQMQRLVLRPFTSSTTYRNLKRTGQGVLHVTDDVGMLARAAVGKLEPSPEMIPSPQVEGRILTGACRWYAFRVTSLDGLESTLADACVGLFSGDAATQNGTVVTLTDGRHE